MRPYVTRRQKRVAARRDTHRLRTAFRSLLDFWIEHGPSSDFTSADCVQLEWIHTRHDEPSIIYPTPAEPSQT